MQPGHSEVHPALLRAWEHTGQYVVGGYLDGEMVAASAAFLGSFPAGSPGRSLHSHITGVRSGWAGRGVGAALKWHQRQWALARDIPVITWTYDPLVARNAHFNLTRLGAQLVEYLPDFYGSMPDARNAGQPSDRTMVAWELRSGQVAERAAGVMPVTPEAPAVVLRVGENGEPVEARRDRSAGVRVELPADIEAVRVADPGLALQWRLALRRVLPGLLHRPAFFDRSAYVFSAQESA